MKPQIILLLLGLIGIGCRIAYSLIGTTIDSNGVMQEAFYLLPISYLLILIGFGGFLLTKLIANAKRS